MKQKQLVALLSLLLCIAGVTVFDALSKTQSVVESAIHGDTHPPAFPDTQVARLQLLEIAPVTGWLTVRLQESVQPEQRMSRASRPIRRPVDDEVANLAQYDAPRTNDRIAADCQVTSASDAGAGTLRKCLLDATVSSTITFSSTVFPPATPISISLETALPPILLDGISIDASDSGVILDGQKLTAGDGLVIDGANGVAIRGLEIIDFAVFHGVVLRNGATNAVIGGEGAGQGNVFKGNNAGVWLRDSGTMSNTIAGNAMLDNVVGVSIAMSASNNLIGGATAGARNLIGDNLFGVSIEDEGTTANQVAGNYIGVNAAGTAALANSEGVAIERGATGNIIGGSQSGEGNIISGNRDIGVTLADAGTSGNVIAGNYIGLNAAGTGAIANAVGVAFLPGATGNFVGDGTAGGRNIISGNTTSGVHFEGPNTTLNQVIGNTIGADASGSRPVSNPTGVFIGFAAKDNIIGGATAGQGNIISGNTVNGIQFQDSGTTGNKILGNTIGLNAAGTLALANQFGIVMGYIFDGVQDNEIGGDSAGAGNLISGNTEAGIALMGAPTTGNKILGNIIGLNANGSAALSNKVGVGMLLGATNNQVGGATAGQGNVISGNATAGLAIGQIGAGNSKVQGNIIGTDPEGKRALGNGVGIGLELGTTSNDIGGVGQNAGNLISGNIFGIQMAGSDVTGNRIQGNNVGVNISGTASLANGTGIVLASGTNGNTLAKNLVSGNTNAGIQLQQAGTDGNLIWGNLIGSNAAGTGPLPNELGIGIGFEAKNNVLGGVTTEKRNVISGNIEAGVVFQGSNTSGNKLQGSYIGTNASGDAAMANNVGIFVIDGAGNNRIGDTTSGAGNVISGNTEAGLAFTGANTANNSALGNFIGLNAAGTAAIANGTGIHIYQAASNNTVGGTTAGGGNVLSGNSGPGVLLAGAGTSGNLVAGNLIGLDASGAMSMGNGSAGISLVDGATGNTVGISNTIAFNGGPGVAIGGAATLGNTITRNTIQGNSHAPIAYVNTPDPVPEPDLLYSENDGLLSGTVCANCVVEVFANPSSVIAGSQFLLGIMADNQGMISTTLTVPPGMSYLTATVTDTGDSTSEFSAVEASSKFYVHLPMVVR